MNTYGVIALLAGLSVGAIGQASAAVCTTAPTYTCANGATTFPGTYVGTVGSGANNVRQIGNLNSGNASVTVAANPSIYSFFWGGGNLFIQEELGNNGIGDAIDVELDSLASQASTAPSAILSSISIPFTSGPSKEYTVYSGYLGQGYYAIDSYLAVGNVQDPNYQVNFAVPEPGTMTLIGSGLIGLAGLRRRRAA